MTLAWLNSGTTFVIGIAWWVLFSSALAIAVGRTIRDADERAHHDLRSIEEFDRARRKLKEPSA